MYQLFSPESKVYQLVSKIVSSVWLNILWTVCSLPVFTAGAATTALHHVSLKVVREEGGNLTKEFFRSFKENFKQATVIWLMLLVLGIVLAVDGYVFSRMRYDGLIWTLGYAVFFVALAAYAIVMMWVFPLLAKFNNTTFAMLRNSLMIGMRFLMCSVFMAAVYFAMVVIVVRVFTPAVIFGHGTCALVCAWLSSNILLQCEQKSQEVPNGNETEEILEP